MSSAVVFATLQLLNSTPMYRICQGGVKRKTWYLAWVWGVRAKRAKQPLRGADRATKAIRYTLQRCYLRRGAAICPSTQARLVAPAVYGTGLRGGGQAPFGQKKSPQR